MPMAHMFLQAFNLIFKENSEDDNIWIESSVPPNFLIRKLFGHLCFHQISAPPQSSWVTLGKLTSLWPFCYL